MCMNTQEVFISNKIYKKPVRFFKTVCKSQKWYPRPPPDKNNGSSLREMLSCLFAAFSLKRMRKSTFLHWPTFHNTELRDEKGMSGQSVISTNSTNLGPFGANSVIIFGLSFSIRWHTSIFQKLYRFSGN